MYDARSSNHFVCRITLEVEGADRTTDFQCERPGLDSRQGPHQFRVIKIDFNTPEFGELADLPENNRGNTPCVA